VSMTKRNIGGDYWLWRHLLVLKGLSFGNCWFWLLVMMALIVSTIKRNIGY